MQPYTRYTYQTAHTLPIQSEDRTNITVFDRSLDAYCAFTYFDYETLEKCIQKLAASGGEISVLDCGAGSGNALDALLKGPLGISIQKCVGISLHYFKNVANLFQSHKDKIEWIFGPAEKILPDLTEKFDLIFDVYGAYFYSPERSILLEQYHRVLKIGGQGTICPVFCNENTIQVSDIKCDLEIFFSTNYPGEFTIKKRQSFPIILEINKLSPTLPGEKFAFSSIEESESSLSKASLVRSEDKLKRGNAWRPKRVLFKPLWK